MHLSKADCPTSAVDIKECSAFPYRAVIGSLLYLSVGTSPDLAFTVSYLSRFLANPGIPHIKAAKRVLRYIRSCPDLGICYTAAGGYGPGSAAVSTSLPALTPIVYSDASYSDCIDSRRSSSGHVVLLAGGPVSWKSSLQTSVTLSSTEAEYRQLTQSAKEVIWVCALLTAMGFPVTSSVPVLGDNKGSIDLVKNPIFHSRSKHIEVRHHFVREKYLSGVLHPVWVDTSRMLADIFTKCLPETTHSRFRKFFNGSYNLLNILFLWSLYSVFRCSCVMPGGVF